ncbi:hypothetical protein NQZ79_g7150 [Umbelopsis isabellina]|nr:hypothetical protein NQZ79_g7150 [Umbelopsis isabellina]
MDDSKPRNRNLFYEQLNCVPESNKTGAAFSSRQSRKWKRRQVGNHASNAYADICILIAIRYIVSPVFDQIQKAYEVLNDPSKRAIYDRWRTSTLQVPFDVFQGLGSHAQTLHWQSLPSQQTITLNSDSNTEDIPHDAQVIQSIPLQNGRTIQIGSAWKKDNSDELYSQFRNYEI